MRVPWAKSKVEQLDLLALEANESGPAAVVPSESDRKGADERSISVPNDFVEGRPLLVPLEAVIEDPGNPRTEYPIPDLNELAEDIREHGILQPIVVHPADGNGRYLVHFGTKRLRAAQRAGLTVVPVVVREAAADPYTQVAENQKRHGLSPIDLARFIKSRVDLGESNAGIAKRLGMNLTSVAHHLTLLDLPPELDQALKSGRCTSPRTLHELHKLHAEQPDQVRGLVAGDVEITRATVAALREGPGAAIDASPLAPMLDQVNAACARLEKALDRLKKSKVAFLDADLADLRRRIADLSNRLAGGV